MNPDLPLPAPDEATPTGPSNLRLRVIWGALAAVLLISCTWGGPVSFGLFFAAVQAVILKEFYRIMRAAGYKPAFWWGIVAGVLIFLATTSSFGVFATRPETSLGDDYSLVVSLAVLGVLPVVLPIALVVRAMKRWPQEEQPFANIAVTIFGLFYVSLPMATLNYLSLIKQHLPSNEMTWVFDPRRIFFLIFLVWSADTGAYFAGKNFGRHKLAPSISPGKTWEGWAGGAVLTLVVAASVGYFLPTIPLGHRLVAGAVVAVFGPLGDLAESMLKRSAGVKDSGTFLPGHGGLLDRFDAFLLVLPVLALLQALAG